MPNVCEQRCLSAENTCGVILKIVKILLCSTILFAVPCKPHTAYELAEKSLSEMSKDLDSGRVSSVDLVRAYKARIAAMNPMLNAVTVINPRAVADAAASDVQRKTGRKMGALAGIPILIKDNIETSDQMATTAGSIALKDNITHRDAPVVARLRAAGAIILGKTNMSEWANFRSDHSIAGWSGIGGQVRNPYALDRSASGSSSGSAVAASASLAAATIGTETDGSITGPSSINGIVGLKPTVGMISRTHIVPITHSEDTPGPMARNVADIALLLSTMSGSDPADDTTVPADAHRVDYLSALRPDALRGARIGVLRYASNFHQETAQVFEAALGALRVAGATLVDIEAFPGNHDIDEPELLLMRTEFKTGLNQYLASTSPAQVPTRTLGELIVFNQNHARDEMRFFGQEELIKSDATLGLDNPAYQQAVANAKQWTGPQGIDKMLSDNRVSVLIAPTFGPAWLIDPILKDHKVTGGVGQALAVAGYPHLTVPMGQVAGLPVGLSFVATAWSEATLIGYGYAFEQATHARWAPKYLLSVTGERVPRQSTRSGNTAATPSD